MGRTAVLSGNWYVFYWRTLMRLLIISRAGRLYALSDATAAGVQDLFDLAVFALNAHAHPTAIAGMCATVRSVLERNGQDVITVHAPVPIVPALACLKLAIAISHAVDAADF
jgi:hypothetical protein